MKTQTISRRAVRRPGRAMAARRDSAGVMLIEALVSVLIFSFGILGTVALYARAVQYSTSAEDRSRAALLANDIAAAMWLRGTNNPADPRLAAAYAAWQARVGVATGAGLPGGVGTVVTAGGTATITVTWTPTFGGAATQQFVTQVTM